MSIPHLSNSQGGGEFNDLKIGNRSHFLSACGGLYFASSGLKIFACFVAQGVALG